MDPYAWGIVRGPDELYACGFKGRFDFFEIVFPRCRDANCCFVSLYRRRPYSCLLGKHFY